MRRKKSMYKVEVVCPDGTREELLDSHYENVELFDTEEEATEAGLDYLNNIMTGAEVLHMSNPGDYPYDEDMLDDYDIEVVEV